MAHFVAVLTALGHAELHVVFSQHGLVRLKVSRAGITQRCSDLVAQGPLEAADFVLLPLHRPVSLRLHRGVENLTALALHQCVVGLVDALRPGGVSLQRLARQEVVVADVNMVVEMTALAVSMGHDEVVRTVHVLGEHPTQLVHTLDVGGVVHVELVGAEVLRVAVQLDLAPVVFTPRNELVGIVDG